MKILVTGGREFDDYAFLTAALDTLHGRRTITEVIHGGARGADTLAGRWAICASIPVREFKALWGTYHGARAGPIRNAQMLLDGRPDLVVAFPGNRGTADMVRRSRDAGVRVWTPKYLR